MNKRTIYLKLLNTIICLILTSVLLAQEPLVLLEKIDKGLPASGLNGSSLGDYIFYIGDINNDGYDD